MRTVAGELENVLNIYGVETDVVGSGRTDGGVHALNQVIHFDIPKHFCDANKLKYILNRGLKNNRADDIGIKRLEVVDHSFHARFSAKRRSYRYLLSASLPTPFLRNYVHFINGVDIGAIRDAMTIFEGRHDFEFFRKVGSAERDTIRTIQKVRLYSFNDFFVLYFEADSFLRSQIRMIVGALIALGEHKIGKAELESQLRKEQLYFREPAPPNGLYLHRIHY